MPTTNSSYEFIKNKINAYKTKYPSLRNKSDSHVFSAVCLKSNYFKNPALNFEENYFEKMIVDGQYDGGVDVLLTDPNSDESDMVIIQSKYYETITRDNVVNALNKMVDFIKDMQQGRFETVNHTVQGKYISISSEMSEDAKIQLVLYTSAPKNSMRIPSIIDSTKRKFVDSDKIDVKILFGNDIVEEIQEAESRRPSVEYGKITMDESDNYLIYKDAEDSAIINVSAFSIKKLYAEHGNNLLARNLRYHIKGRDIDKAIKDTIQEKPDQFWMMNNGITIVCDSFEIDGKEVRLNNFSIINGGQTTYLLHKSRYINETQDLFLPCKIIRILGDDEDQKNTFALSIAKATNTQKAIKPSDLKANTPEQVRFATTMREKNLFYQTKRGEIVPAAYKEPHLNSDLAEIGKLCLAAIFQMPGTSRNKPSSLYLPKYYEKIFNSDQSQVANICKELLYIDSYYKNRFLKKYDIEAEQYPNAEDHIQFAHNARTICIAFVAFACRYKQDNFSTNDLRTIFNASRNDDITDSGVYDVFANLNAITNLLPPELFNQKDKYEAILYELFKLIITAGVSAFQSAKYYDNTLVVSNYLKKDKNYYLIIKNYWQIMLEPNINTIWNTISAE